MKTSAILGITGSATVFRSFESRVLHLLLGAHFGPYATNKLIRESDLLQLENHQHGYAIVVTHRDLSSSELRFDSPRVLGKYEDMKVTFSAFVKSDQLRLECQAQGSSAMHPYFRERDILVHAAQS